MPWFSNPQRDSRKDIRAAQQALVYAGIPRADAVAEVAIHLRRVRAALAPPRQVAGAGFLTGASLAVGVLLVLAVALVGRELLAPAAGESRTPADADVGSLVGMLAAVAAVPVLGVTGAGLAWVTRYRWRRPGALGIASHGRAHRHDPLATAGILLGVAVAVVLIAWYLSNPRLIGRWALLLALLTIPVGAAAFAAWFARLYPWILSRVSPLDAAAAARPLLQREAARQIESEREFYGRSAYHRTGYERSRWADEILRREARGYAADARRRRAVALDIARRTGPDRHAVPPWRRFARSLVLAAGSATATAFVIYRLAWHAARGRPGDGAEVVAVILGIVIGVGLTWLYASYFEGK